MRFLADENIPWASVVALREAGHDVAAVVERSPGASDPEVLRDATSDGRILLTFDRDFGELVYRFGHVGGTGIVYFRSPPRTPLEPVTRLLGLLAARETHLEGSLTVIANTDIRQRRFPL